MQEYRELKLRLARKENELKHCQQQLAESKQGKQMGRNENDEL